MAKRKSVPPVVYGQAFFVAPFVMCMVAHLVYMAKQDTGDSKCRTVTLKSVMATIWHLKKK